MAILEPSSKPDLIDVFNSLSEIPLKYRDHAQALEKIVQIGKRALSSHACTLTFVELENRTLTIVAAAGPNEDFEKEMLNRKVELGSVLDGVFIDYELVARGMPVELHGLREDGQGVADPHIAKKYNLGSLLSYPLKSDGRLRGYFNHFVARDETFTDEEKKLIEVFAQQAVIVIEKLEDVRGRTNFERLNDIVREMTAARDSEELLRLVLRKGLELVRSDRGWISRLDFNTGELSIVAQQGNPQNPYTLKIGQGITGHALQEQKPMRVGNVKKRELQGVYAEYWEDTRSELAVPIMISNAEIRVGRDVALGPKPIGVFNVESPLVEAFSLADETVLWALVRYAALLFDRLESDRKLRRLIQIQGEMIGKQDWDVIIQKMMEGIKETLGFEYVNVSLVKHEQNLIKTEYIIGIPEPDQEAFKTLATHPLDSTDIQAVIARTRQIEVPSREDNRFDRKIYRRFRHDLFIRVFVPMIAPTDDSVIGTVEAGYPDDHRNYIYEQDVQHLKGFIDYTAQALQWTQREIIERTSHELKSVAVSIRSNASFLQRRRHDLPDELVEIKFDDILLDCELLTNQVMELEYTLGGEPPSRSAERTLVFRDIIIKTINQFRVLMPKEFDASRIYDPADVHKMKPIYVDRVGLNQVVQNLIINAIKYAEADPKKFAIRISVDDNKSSFILKVKDWGIGINKEYKEKVFVRGFRTPEAIEKDVSGNGLGLTLAKDIMRGMGGDLRLEQHYKPTEFWIILPKSLKEVR